MGYFKLTKITFSNLSVRDGCMLTTGNLWSTTLTVSGNATWCSHPSNNRASSIIKSHYRPIICLSRAYVSVEGKEKQKSSLPFQGVNGWRLHIGPRCLLSAINVLLFNNNHWSTLHRLATIHLSQTRQTADRQHSANTDSCLARLQAVPVINDAGGDYFKRQITNHMKARITWIQSFSATKDSQTNK